MINKNTIARFIWSFGHEFFLETADGNYIWSDPDYNGDNTIHKFNGSLKDWCKKINVPFGRDKGQHIIGQYCGENVEIID